MGGVTGPFTDAEVAAAIARRQAETAALKAADPSMQFGAPAMESEAIDRTFREHFAIASVGILADALTAPSHGPVPMRATTEILAEAQVAFGDELRLVFIDPGVDPLLTLVDANGNFAKVSLGTMRGLSGTVAADHANAKATRCPLVGRSGPSVAAVCSALPTQDTARLVNLRSARQARLIVLLTLLRHYGSMGRRRAASSSGINSCKRRSRSGNKRRSTRHSGNWPCSNRSRSSNNCSSSSARPSPPS